MAKVTPDTQRQGARLRALREARAWSKPYVAARLGFESTQSVDLYERGISVIRMDQVTTWAQAFEMSREDFVEAVMGGVLPEAGWTFRAALRGHIPESDIEELARYWEGRPLINQQSAVQGILQMAESQRRRATANHLDTTRAV